MKNSQEGIELAAERLVREVPAGSPRHFAWKHTGNYGLSLCCLFTGKGDAPGTAPARSVNLLAT